MLLFSMANRSIDWEFQQDNARIHTTPAVLQWFEQNLVTLYPHPPYSPDLNPIENVWSLLKHRISQCPRASLGIGQSLAAGKAFHKAIQEQWEKIPQEVIDNCILSLPRRYQAVIEAKGYQTKY